MATYSKHLAFVLSFFAALAAFSFAAPAASAQSFRGGIRGTITDSSGGVIAGAKVTARNLGTSETREVTADPDGSYMFLELPAGEYEISAIAPGFQEVHQGQVIVNVGAETVGDLKLAKPNEKVETVVISEDVPLVETSSTTLSQVVDRRLVQELPLNGRDFGKLVALTPGVTVEGSGVAGTEKGFGQFNINGNRDRSNNYTLDGTDNNDPWFNNSALNQVGITGAPATLLPLDAIQEFSLQSNFSAEYGRNSGSVVNVLTRSGSNQLHGSLYEYNRNSAYDARNYFNTVLDQNGNPNPQSPFNNNNFGGSLGGPIFRDKTFFFGAYEGQRERVGSDFVFSVPTAAEIAAARTAALAMNPAINPVPLDKILAAFPSSATGNISSTVKDQNDSDNFIVKIDHRFSSANSIAARYAFGQDDQIFPLGSLGGSGSGSRLPEFAQVSPTRVQVFSASWLSVFSSSRLNEIRFGYTRFRNSFGSRDDKLNLADPAVAGLNIGTGKLGFPEIDFTGIIENLGATAFSIPRARVSQNFQGLDNFTWIRGRHTFKFGGEFRRAAVNAFNDNLERGLIGFFPAGAETDHNSQVIDILTQFYLGNASPSSFSTAANSGFTRRTTYTNGLSFFAQDDLRLHPNLTLNLGLRWEYFGPLSEKNNLLTNLVGGKLVRVGTSGLGSLYHRDLNNFGPRIGVAWTPLHNTTVRTSYGVYYDYVPQHLIIANFTTTAGVATNPDPANPIANVPLGFSPNAFNGSVPGPVFTPISGPFPIFATDLNLRTPYVQSWSLNIQQQLTSSFAFQAGYVGSKGTKLARLYDLNQNGANPNFSTIDIFSTGASSTYHALQLTANLQGWHRFSGFSTYAWSKSLDTASDGIDFNFAGAAFPQDSFNLAAEKGPSTFDTRHRWTSALNYQAPTFSHVPKLLGEGWQLNTVFTLQSGRPIPVLTGGGNNGHQRPDIVPGQPFTLPNWHPSTGYLNPNAFASPAAASGFGNLGRDQIFGPGFKNVDFSVSKNFALWESAKLQFRTEFFNVFNHPNFSLPNGFITPSVGPAGTVTATPDVAQGNPGLGGGGPRVLQFGLRLQF
jgi:Carboxypeptidase regulatory-like domain/TonB-dependent Receptor Plug Domain/TonB dependent receptor